MDNADDKIIRLYSRLDSLKQNLPANTLIINEKYVLEYHLIVDELSKITNSELSEFKIGDNEIKHRLISSNHRTKETNYSKERYCDRNFLLAKLDALLSYFQIKYLSQEKRTIGFKK